MKTITKTVLLVLLFTSLIGSAQDHMRERLKAQKVAFITDQLPLNADEAQKFWPIYNAFETNTHRLRKVDMRRLKEDFETGGGENISEADAEKLLKRLVKIEEEMYNEHTALISKLRKVISAKKIIKLKKIEEEFNKKIIKKFREQRMKRMNGGK